MTLRNLSIAFWLVCVFPIQGWTQEVEVKNNFFYIDGQKFFVKGIGYEAGALPGEVPWEKTFNPDQLHFDIQRILSGGYNTIRTWGAFSEEELDLLQTYDIKIIMGIWIAPDADFNDEAFVNEAKNIVTNVLSYSKNYDNIIAYLIMNEPLPETIFGAGLDNTVDLWTELIHIIHTQHPGRPVSIANTCNGTYIDPEIFDFSAYNAYIYNPVTINYLHGYRDYIHYLQQLNVTGHPLIITEYGLSVSPSGAGNWGYGGNSLTEQKEGILHMYRSLVNGGASGSCVFNYSDGWWKAGDEFTHDDDAEEWFGLVEYTSLSDNEGQVRPVWDDVQSYQSAIITQPNSAEIYTKKVPVEVFLNENIDSIVVLLDNALIYQNQTENAYLTDTIVFDYPDVKDVILEFKCYDTENSLVKSEEKSILISDNELTLPTIQMSHNDDFRETGSIEVNYQINKSEDFTTGSQLDHIFYPHVGFNYGQKFQTTMPAGTEVNITEEHTIDSSVHVFTLGAAFDISYNDFKKRIVNQVTITKTDEVISSIRNESPLSDPIQIYPNPADKHVSIKSPEKFTITEVKIMDINGKVIRQINKNFSTIDTYGLTKGTYLMIITINEDRVTKPFIID